uniref:Uncharacterized protein n=1 Tax=Anguilla anguilla TaxID=7936 RepID=A0A0E9THZ4_ANGAN
MNTVEYKTYARCLRIMETRLLATC